ncbi:MAG: hypothetical protein OHK006_23070 [Thermodesulfovibrionales bacterium]
MKASDFDGDLSAFLSLYKYQPELTIHLDNLDNASIDQAKINEIVLWKVNRYVTLGEDAIAQLKKLQTLRTGEYAKGREMLKLLLGIKGVDLPMASTILRFINPKVYQIIDRHAYRAVYDKNYPLYHSTPVEKKMAVYFDYLADLLNLCQKKGLIFATVDRLLYIFDKQQNGNL